MLFADRRDAGRVLAGLLTKYANRDDVLVLALPRGGVPVAFEVAHALRAPLDVFIVRKLGVPGQDELAMGAIATGGVRVLNEDVVGALGLSAKVIGAFAAKDASRGTGVRGDAADVQRRRSLVRGRFPDERWRGARAARASANLRGLTKRWLHDECK